MVTPTVGEHRSPPQSLSTKSVGTSMPSPGERGDRFSGGRGMAAEPVAEEVCYKVQIGRFSPAFLIRHG